MRHKLPTGRAFRPGAVTTGTVLAVLLAVARVGGGAAPADAAVAHARPAPVWIVGSFPLSQVDQLDPAVTERTFGGGTTFVTLSDGLQSLPSLPAGWGLVPVLRFTSYATMAAAFAAGLPAGVRAVGYDNEASGPTRQFTPAVELADPAKYDALAAALVHRHGLEFLQLGNAGGVPTGAAGADVYDLQLQDGQNASDFAAKVAKDVALVRAVNPTCRVLVGLTTARASGAQVAAAARSVASLVDGFWLNVPAPGVGTPRVKESNPRAAVTFLTLYG